MKSRNGPAHGDGVSVVNILILEITHSGRSTPPNIQMEIDSSCRRTGPVHRDGVYVVIVLLPKTASDGCGHVHGDGVYVVNVLILKIPNWMRSRNGPVHGDGM